MVRPMTTLRSPDGTPASRFAFGAMQFGGRADEAASAAMFEAALAAGITHFDTAWIYTDGRSEEILGRLARPHRDRLTIATKAGYKGGAGPDNLQAQFDESRRRLGMDRVEILYLHRFDPETPLARTMDWLAEAQAAGGFAHVGLSNFAAWQVMKAQALAAERGTRIDVIQPMYNLVKRQAEVELLPMCMAEDILPVPYSPLGGGLLTGKYARAGASGRLTEQENYGRRYRLPWMHDAAVALGDLAEELGTHPATLAAAWVAAHPARPVPILSARSAEQLAPSLAALTYPMDAALRARLSALAPAPPPATDRLEEQE
jgi:aryl-alcohol dehydrogenase-like predicted oxidoreductase